MCDLLPHSLSVFKVMSWSKQPSVVTNNGFVYFFNIIIKSHIVYIWCVSTHGVIIIFDAQDALSWLLCLLLWHIHSLNKGIWT